jgi:hypothetical protein
LESSLKRHTALIKRIRQSIGLDNREQILKDIESLTLEKYIEEIAGAVPEGIVRCKLEKDVWSATEVRHLGGHKGTSLTRIYSCPGHLGPSSALFNEFYASPRCCARYRARAVE